MYTMKTFKIYFLLCLTVFTLNSCDEERVVDDVNNTVTSGLILRTISLIRNEIPIGAEDAGFTVLLEAQDEQDGALLESVDVFVTFNDGSPDVGDTSNGIVGEELFVMNVPASAFTEEPVDGLPRGIIDIPASQLLSLVNLDSENLFGGDNFQERLVANLTDGRSFTNTDVNGNVGQGTFFRSPFIYTTNVVCPVEGFLGEYQLTVLEGVFPAFNATLSYPDGPVNIIPGEGDTERVIEELCFLPEFGVFCGPFNLQLICGEVIVPEQTPGGGVGCGGAILSSTDGVDDLGQYDFQNDTTFQVRFLDNQPGDSNCEDAPPYTVTFELTRQ